MSSREVALSYLRSFSSGEPDQVAAHVTADFDNRQVGVLGSGCQGADAYRERLKEFLSTFRNLNYRIEEVIEEGDKVAVAYVMTFDHGKEPVTIPGVMLMTVRDGLIAERSDYWDGLAYLRQTGQEG